MTKAWVLCENEKERDKLFLFLKEKGITWITGIPIEEIRPIFMGIGYIQSNSGITQGWENSSDLKPFKVSMKEFKKYICRQFDKIYYEDSQLEFEF